MDHYENNWQHLSDELKWIDLLLYIHILKSRMAQQGYDEGTSIDLMSLDEFRGLVITDEEIDGLFSEQISTEPPEIQHLMGLLMSLEADIRKRLETSIRRGIPLSFAHLSELFCLSDFEKRVILLCLAPELERKYERIYAYLQNDVTQKKPTVELALSLFCAAQDDRLAAMSAFSYRSSLLRFGFVQIDNGLQEGTGSLLSRPLGLDARILDFILGFDAIDERLSPFAEMVVPRITWDQVWIPENVKEKMLLVTRKYMEHVQEADRKPIYMLHGDYGTGKREAAEALCRDTGINLLVCNMSAMLDGPATFADLVILLFREAILQNAAVYLDGFEYLVGSEKSTIYISSLFKAFEALSPLTFLDSKADWEPTSEFEDHLFMNISFPVPDYEVRKNWWNSLLRSSNCHVSPEVNIDELASNFRISGGQIRDAIAKARNMAIWRDPDNGQMEMADLNLACRAKSNQNLRHLALKLEPKYLWDDIVLPAERISQLQEICRHAEYRHIVYGNWGFDRKLSYGKGVNALFSGPAGTGKTMAAEVIANELQRDIYKIDLSQVVSKYIGETEKNLHRIFQEAYGSNAILFFDEADALFGKRSEVKDAHDRYANIEIAYLLQKMEEYDGITILATNLRKNIDEAFTRRMQFIVEFPFPDEEMRRRIWSIIFPKEMPISEEVNLDVLAERFRLSGGNIKNIALAGAFCAAGDGGVVQMTHLIHAVRREYQKLGRTWDDSTAIQENP